MQQWISHTLGVNIEELRGCYILVRPPINRIGSKNEFLCMRCTDCSFHTTRGWKVIGWIAMIGSSLPLDAMKSWNNIKVNNMRREP